MHPNGITTVGKTFRVKCTVIDERFVGWFDLDGNEVKARLIPDSLVRDKFYVEERGNSYTLVIQDVGVADGGNYTCKGDKTENIFTLFVECKYPFLVDSFCITSFQSPHTGQTRSQAFPFPGTRLIIGHFWVALSLIMKARLNTTCLHVDENWFSS